MLRDFITETHIKFFYKAMNVNDINIAVIFLHHWRSINFVVVVRSGSAWPWLIHTKEYFFLWRYFFHNLIFLLQAERRRKTSRKRKVIKYFNPFSFSMKNIPFMPFSLHNKQTAIVGVRRIQSKYYCVQLHYYSMKYCLVL